MGIQPGTTADSKVDIVDSAERLLRPALDAVEEENLAAVDIVDSAERLLRFVPLEA